MTEKPELLNLARDLHPVNRSRKRFNASWGGLAASLVSRRPALPGGQIFKASKLETSGLCARCNALFGHQFCQFSGFKHFHHNVRPADEFAFDIELGNGWPI